MEMAQKPTFKMLFLGWRVLQKGHSLQVLRHPRGSGKGFCKSVSHWPIFHMKVSYWLKCKGERILLVTKVRRIFGGRNTCESIWLIKKFTKVIYCHLMLLFTHLLLSTGTSHRKNDNMSSWRRRLNINANRRNLSILI